MCSFKLPKEVDTLAGYTKNREKNYEMKYLRKVLGQVDERIQVPESVSADSLRRLLDTVEEPRVREVTPRRPFRLSLQSGVAYAAAFSLIVALFYATRLYRPDIITGGMPISTSQQQQAAALDGGNNAEDTAMTSGGAQAAPFAADSPDAPVAEQIALNQVEPVAETQGDATDAASRPSAFGVGGSGKATLVFEQDEYAFYWRENDLSDPDRATPISFEAVDIETQETVAQADVPLLAVAQSFEIDGSIVLVGNDFEGGAAVCSYDISVSDGSFAENMFAQDGELVDARRHNNYVHVVSLSDTGEAGQDSELLPNAVSGETCVITAFNVELQTTVTKRFIGANGTVHLDEQSAYIQYTGQDDDGKTKDYIAQILFNGMDITLGTVS